MSRKHRQSNVITSMQLDHVARTWGVPLRLPPKVASGRFVDSDQKTPLWVRDSSCGGNTLLCTGMLIA